MIRNVLWADVSFAVGNLFAGQVYNQLVTVIRLNFYSK